MPEALWSGCSGHAYLKFHLKCFKWGVFVLQVKLNFNADDSPLKGPTRNIVIQVS